MQAPTAQPTGSNAGQYHTMGAGATATATSGSGTGCNCGAGGGAPSSSGQQREPGLDSSATVAGQSVSEAAASLFAPGDLDQQDALLLWTGVNSLLFAALIYLEVTR